MNIKIILFIYTLLSSVQIVFSQDENKYHSTYDIITTRGTITVGMLSETPLHAENFQKLVKSDFYDSVLFHRVIKDFMIQTGDPGSKNAPRSKRLGTEGPGYTVPAEIKPDFFHQYGVISAARLGDNVNPERASSGSQFYIVVGKPHTDADLDRFEQSIQQKQKQFYLRQYYQQYAEPYKDSLTPALQQHIYQMAMNAVNTKLSNEKPFHYTPEQREIYKTNGGTPHLDQSYTIFGKVIKGMDIVEKIAQLPTDRADRPVEDVLIIDIIEKSK